MKFPSYVPNKTKLVPKGHYVFEFIDEPEEREGTKGGVFFILKLNIISGLDNPRKYNHIIFPWETRYSDLLLALGGKKNDQGEVDLDEVNLIGRRFEADLIHVEDPRKPSIIRDKIINFKVVDDDVSPSGNGHEKDPF